MKKSIAFVLLLFCGALTLPGEGVVLIKGKSNRARNIKLSAKAASCRVKKHSGATEITFRPRKNALKYTFSFAVQEDDEFALTFGGNYSRLEEKRQNEAEWIACSSFKVNGKELINPKDGRKEEIFPAPRPFPASLKLKKGEKLTFEFSARSMTRKEVKAAKKSASLKKLSRRQQEQLKREEEKDKLRAAEREKELQERKVSDEKARKVLEERYGIKFNSKRSSEKQSAAENRDSDAEKEE